jgi:hypothetical protein
VNHEWVGMDTKMGRERHHTPSLRATPLKRGSVGRRGRLGLVERKGDEWTAAALVRLAVTVGGLCGRWEVCVGSRKSG